MSDQLLEVAEDFWNIRGDFRIGGVVNIGTHASLVRRGNGNFVLLDAYTLTGAIKEQVDTATDGGARLEAIINLHPFHTVHVENAHRQYPEAKLYGTRRHLERFPHLPWQAERTESAQFAALYADDFAFSVPAGVDFISSNPHLHFSSVLAYHPRSRTIHSDDTLMYLPLPGPLGRVVRPRVTFHITLSKTLQKRPGAAQEFRAWAERLVEQWRDAEHLCAAHSATLSTDANAGPSIAEQITAALEKVDKKVLQRHEAKYG